MNNNIVIDKQEAIFYTNERGQNLMNLKFRRLDKESNIYIHYNIYDILLDDLVMDVTINYSCGGEGNERNENETIIERRLILPIISNKIVDMVKVEEIE